MCKEFQAIRKYKKQAVMFILLTLIMISKKTKYH